MASVQSLTGDGMGMTCSDSTGCTTENPVLYTLLGFSFRLTTPLLAAGIVFLAAAQTLAAFAPAPAAPVASAPPAETDTVTLRRPTLSAPPRVIAVRLWILGGALVVAATALGVWSASPASQQVMMAGSLDRSGPAYILSQLSYSLVPPGILAGFLVCGLAVIVSWGQPRELARRTAPDEAEGREWNGRDYDPFKRPGDPASHD